jgi:hypothetical protein
MSASATRLLKVLSVLVWAGLLLRDLDLRNTILFRIHQPFAEAARTLGFDQENKVGEHKCNTCC